MLDFMFSVFAGIALLSALVLVLHRSVVHSAFALVGTLFGVAGLYWTLGADFLGATQLLLYVGGVTVLLLFAVMLTTRDTQRLSAGRVIVALGVAAALAWGLQGTIAPLVAIVGESGLGQELVASTDAIGMALLDPDGYLVPFEAIAVLLLVVLVGAVTIARRGSEPR